jgi:ParB family transcriptional regulator, chromosome partitioning protein
MSKKKRFMISSSLNQGLTDTMNAVYNNAGSVRFEVIPLTRIDTDPDNPRELKLTKEEAINGISKENESYVEKNNEIESLQSLAETITKKGLINPVVVYKNGENYRLVAGERRFLASLIAKRQDIQARILNEKPNSLDLRLLQWIENTEREDLTLKDRIGNVKSILKEYLKQYPQTEVSPSLIKQLIGVSLPQASCYYAVLNATNDVEEVINNGNINNLDKAALISKLSSQELRNKAIEFCIAGSTLKQLRQLIENENISQEAHKGSSVKKKKGRAASRVNLGSTTNTDVVKKIISSVLKDMQFKQFEATFRNVNWDSYTDVANAFRKFVQILEKEGTN